MALAASFHLSLSPSPSLLHRDAPRFSGGPPGTELCPTALPHSAIRVGTEGPPEYGTKAEAARSPGRSSVPSTVLQLIPGKRQTLTILTPKVRLKRMEGLGRSADTLHLLQAHRTPLCSPPLVCFQIPAAEIVPPEGSKQDGPDAKANKINPKCSPSATAQPRLGDGGTELHPIGLGCCPGTWGCHHSQRCDTAGRGGGQYWCSLPVSPKLSAVVDSIEGKDGIQRGLGR